MEYFAHLAPGLVWARTTSRPSPSHHNPRVDQLRPLPFQRRCEPLVFNSPPASKLRVCPRLVKLAEVMSAR